MSWAVRSQEHGTFPWFISEMGNATGLPTNPASLDHEQRARLKSIITAGVHRFYYPEPGQFTIPDATEAQKERLRRAPHSWSFLTNVLEIEIQPGKTEYDLPADFANFIGEPTTSRKTGRIAIVDNHDQIRQLVNSEAAEGVPQYAAKMVVSGNGKSRVSTKLLVYPIPNEKETIRVQHSITPPDFDEESPYLLCGKEHIETVRACCLAVIEERDGQGNSDFRSRMMERLSASIVIDQTSGGATTEGIYPEDDVIKPGLNRGYIEKMIGLYAGYGPNALTWSAGQRKQVMEFMRGMVRRVLNPPVLPPDKTPHQWSFLTPLETIETQAGKDTYELPAAFASFDGPITYLPGQYRWFDPIKIMGEHQLRQMQQFEHTTLYPRYAALIPRPPSKTVGTRYELLFWPPPDGLYTLQYRYRLSDTALVESEVNRDFIPGGDVHLRTFLEAGTVRSTGLAVSTTACMRRYSSKP